MVLQSGLWLNHQMTPRTEIWMVAQSDCDLDVPRASGTANWMDMRYTSSSADMKAMAEKRRRGLGPLPRKYCSKVRSDLASWFLDKFRPQLLDGWILFHITIFRWQKMFEASLRFKKVLIHCTPLTIMGFIRLLTTKKESSTKSIFVLDLAGLPAGQRIPRQPWTEWWKWSGHDQSTDIRKCQSSWVDRIHSCKPTDWSRESFNEHLRGNAHQGRSYNLPIPMCRGGCCIVGWFDLSPEGEVQDGIVLKVALNINMSNTMMNILHGNSLFVPKLYRQRFHWVFQPCQMNKRIRPITLHAFNRSDAPKVLCILLVDLIFRRKEKSKME